MNAFEEQLQPPPLPRYSAQYFNNNTHKQGRFLLFHVGGGGAGGDT